MPTEWKTLKKNIRKGHFLMLAVSIICFGCTFMACSSNKLSDTATGTFSDTDFPNYEYVVIDENDHFLQYRQNEKIAEGKITASDDTIYIDSDGETLCAVFADYKFYLFDKENDEIKVFEKISNVPTYINMEE